MIGIVTVRRAYRASVAMGFLAALAPAAAQAPADPASWLGTLESPRARAWIAEQRRRTDSALAGLASRDRMRDRLAQIADHMRTLPRIRAGERLFLFESGGVDDAMVVYVRDAEGTWPRVLLDPAASVGDRAVRLTVARPSPDGRYLAYGVALDGSTWEELRVIDARTGQHLPDTLRGVKRSVPAWTRDSRGFFYERYELPPAAGPSAPERGHRVMYHVAGRPQTDDETIHQRTDRADWRYRTVVSDDGLYAVIHVSQAGDQHTRIAFIDLDNPRRPRISAPVVRLIDDPSAIHEFVGSHGTQFYIRTTRGAPRGRLVAVDVNRSDEGYWQTIVRERMDRLIDAVPARDGLLTHHLREGRSILQYVSRDGRLRRDLALPPFSAVTRIEAAAGEPEAYFTVEGIAAPPSVYRFLAETGSLEPVHAPKWAVDATAFTTGVQHIRTPDGHTIPMVMTSRAEARTDTGRRVLLVAASDVAGPVLHRYSPALVAWMDAGGVVAQPMLRGPRDPRGGRSATTPASGLAVDDLLLAADYLRHGSSGTRVAVIGEEHGALLAAAAMHQRPDLFDALGAIDPVVGDVPLSALRRPPPARLPPVMVLFGLADDHVVPSFTARLAAALQSVSGGGPVLARIAEGGGLQRSPLSAQLDAWTDLLAFLDHALSLR